MRLGDGSAINYQGKGIILVKCSDGDNFLLENVLYS